MGNGQSVEAPRRPTNRLSKPRTNSSTNLLNLKDNASSSRRNFELNHAAGRYSTVSVGLVYVEEGEKRQSTQKKRMSIFRSKSVQPRSEPLEISSGANVDFLNRSPLDNWSIRGSVANESPNQPYFAPPAESQSLARSSRTSLQHIPYAQHNPRLSLVAEAPSPQPNQWEDAKRSSHTQIEQLERRRSSQYLQEEDNARVVSGLPERKNSEPEVFAPIRRRSLLQHGIATRKDWVENDSRQSLPSQMPSQVARDDFQNYYYNPAKPTSSPLANIAALASKFGDTSPGPRTMTPNDLEYGHIGAFKLGSLRITNGAASPVDRPATRSGDEDYSMDGRGRANNRLALAPRSNTISAPQEIFTSPWMSRAKSPLRQAYEPEKEPLQVKTHLTLPEFSAFKFTTDSPTKSLDIAREYIEDIALSPFSFDDSPPLTPRLEATSKHTAIEDDLFEAEPKTPVREEMHPTRSFDSGYQAEDLQFKPAIKGQRDIAPKPLAKADSGYSSNVSLRSFAGSSKPVVPAKEAPPTPPKEPASRVASSAYSVTSSYSEVSDMTMKSKSLPTLPTDAMPVPFREAPPVPLKHSSVHKPGNIIPAAILPAKSREQAWAPSATLQVMPQRQKSMPAIPQPLQDEATPSLSASGSTGSERSGSTRSWPKDKKHPQPVYTVQAFQSSSQELSIPSVPVKTSRHLEKRVDSFPVVCFPNTIAGTTQLRSTGSKETLRTIFSVGSAEYREEATYKRLHSALPPTPIHTPIPEARHPTPEINRRRTFQPSIPAPTPISQGRNRQSSQPEAIRRKSTPVQQNVQHAFEKHITSYEAVSSSLGKSPYDVALDPVKNRPTAAERAKSMTSQLEVEARERFARTRSVSQESFTSAKQTIRIPKSLDSPASQASTSSSSLPLRGKPPPAHAKWSGLGSAAANNPRLGRAGALVQQRSNPSLASDDGDGRRSSMLGKERVKSPPPVSLHAQRQMVPTHVGFHVVVPPSRTPPLPPPRNHLPPAPSRRFSPSPEPRGLDPWANQKNFWAERRQSAGESLQGRRSVEFRRPQSRRPSLEQHWPQVLKSHSSWDTSQQSWDGHPEQYGHTYGLPKSAEFSKENWTGQYPTVIPLQQRPYHPQPRTQRQYQPELEYYDGPSYDENDFLEQEKQLPRSIHKRQTSTSEMLVLDRFSGGLDYGY